MAMLKKLSLIMTALATFAGLNLFGLSAMSVDDNETTLGEQLFIWGSLLTVVAVLGSYILAAKKDQPLLYWVPIASPLLFALVLALAQLD